MSLLKDPQNRFLIENECRQQQITRNENPEEVAVINSRVEGVEERINFEVSINRNLDMEDYSELRRQVIEVDDYNYTAPENILQIINTTTTSDTELNWTGAEGVLYPRLASNLPDTPVSFKNYSQEDDMKISKLYLFLILFPLGYLKHVVIPKTNKHLKEPTDLSEFLRFIGCWFYMYLWVFRPSQHSWWSSTTKNMFHGAPFQLNEYMSHNRFYDILGDFRYTNE